MFSSRYRGPTAYRHYIPAGSASVVHTRWASGTNLTFYVTKDHIGSTTTITDSAGALVLNGSFGAYGRRRGANWQGTPSSSEWSAINQTTRRGFTFHEHLDSVALIHMNGRVQDPLLGRFLSADPTVQAPDHSQSFNRYAYAWNNPLSLVDPSGFANHVPAECFDSDCKPRPPPPPPMCGQFRCDRIPANVTHYNLTNGVVCNVNGCTVELSGIGMVKVTIENVVVSRRWSSWPEGVYEEAIQTDVWGTLENDDTILLWTSCWIACKASDALFGNGSFGDGVLLGATRSAHFALDVVKSLSLPDIDAWRRAFDSTASLSAWDVVSIGLDSASALALGLKGATTITNALRYRAIGSTGKIGENFLKSLGGTPNKHFPTSDGARFVDRFVDGVAHESKVGYQTLNADIKRQIAKDAEILKASGQVEAVVWHFFRSPITGEMGMSKQLEQALRNAGFDIVEHW